MKLDLKAAVNSIRSKATSQRHYPGFAHLLKLDQNQALIYETGIVFRNDQIVFTKTLYENNQFYLQSYFIQRLKSEMSDFENLDFALNLVPSDFLHQSRVTITLPTTYFTFHQMELPTTNPADTDKIIRFHMENCPDFIGQTMVANSKTSLDNHPSQDVLLINTKKSIIDELIAVCDKQHIHLANIVCDLNWVNYLPFIIRDPHVKNHKIIIDLESHALKLYFLDNTSFALKK